MEPRLRLKRFSPPAGLELTTARSIGQRLTHLATGAPVKLKTPKTISVTALIFFFFNSVMHLKDSDGMTNSAGHDQTASL